MIEKDRIEDGLVLLKYMLQKNMILDTISYSSVVLAKVKMGNMDAAKGIYEGRIDEATRLLEEMEQLGFKPSGEAFNQLIKGCSSNGKLENSLEFCKQMTRIGLLPSCSSVNQIFEKLCENGKTKWADEMLTMLLDKGFTPDENTYSHLVFGYCKEDDKEGLTKLLFEMEYRSISPNRSLSLAIISLCKSWRLKEAEKYIEIIKAHKLFPCPNIHEALIGY